MRLERIGAIVGLRWDAGTTQLLKEKDAGRSSIGTEGGYIDRRSGRREALLRQHESNPFQPDRKTDSRGLRSSQHLNESVVTPARSDRILSAQMGRSDLERREAIVVQSPHQPRVQPIG